MALENKRSFKTNDKYKLPMICESKCFKGKTFAQISPLLIEKFKKERRESITRKETPRSPATVNRELEILSRVFTLAITYTQTSSHTRPMVSRFEPVKSFWNFYRR